MMAFASLGVSDSEARLSLTLVGSSRSGWTKRR